LWCSVNSRGVLGADGKLDHFDGFLENITEQKKSIAALAESEAQFRRFFEENSSVMLLVDPSSAEILAANRTASTFYGYPRQALVGMHIGQINGLPEDRIQVEAQQALLEERRVFPRPHRMASGEVRDVEVYTSRVNVDGRLMEKRT